jgi:ankyrin repeat protein
MFSKYSHFLFVLSLNVILSQLAFSDGCFVSNNFDKDVYAPDQKVAIAWDGSTETMILATKLQSGTISDFGWLIPIKAFDQPKVILGDMQVFYDLSDYFKPLSGDIRTQTIKEASLSIDDVEVLEKKKLDIYDITVIKAKEGKALAEWLKQNGFKLPFDANETLDFYTNKDFFFIAVKFDLSNKYKTEISEIGSSNLKLIKSVADKIRKQYADVYNISELVMAVIHNKQYDGTFSDYLTREEYEGMQKEYTPVSTTKESSKSIKVICQVISDLKKGIATPLKISFKTDKPSFPLKISSLNKGNVKVTAYILSREPLTDAAGMLKLEKCIPTTKGFKDKIKNYLPVVSSEWVSQLVFDGNSSAFIKDAYLETIDQKTLNKTEDKPEALYRAIRDGDIDKTRLLLRNFSDLNQEILICTPLQYAVANKQVRIAEYLISKGANINPMNPAKEGSVLLSAVFSEDANMIKMLVEKGADINRTKALNYAIMTKNIKTVEFLLKHGASVNKSDEGSETALHIAVEDGQIEIIKLLLANGADINAKDEMGETPLYSLIHLPYDNELPRLLLDNGADPNTTSNGTPILNAIADTQNEEFVEMLLKKGANVNSKDYQGNTPLQIASKYNNQGVINMLKKYGAK